MVRLSSASVVQVPAVPDRDAVPFPIWRERLRQTLHFRALPPQSACIRIGERLLDVVPDKLRAPIVIEAGIEQMGAEPSLRDDARAVWCAILLTREKADAAHFNMRKFAPLVDNGAKPSLTRILSRIPLLKIGRA